MSRLVRDNQYHGKYHYGKDIGHKSMRDSRDFSLAQRWCKSPKSASIVSQTSSGSSVR